MATSKDVPRRTRAAFACVGALGVLAHHDEIGGGGDGTRDPVEGAEVDVKVQFETQPQQQPALYHPRRHRGRADRRTDCAEQDGVDISELVKDGVGQHLAGALVAHRTEVVVDGLDHDSGGRDRLQRLRDDLRADPVAPDHRNFVHANPRFHFPGHASRGVCRGQSEGPERLRRAFLLGAGPGPTARESTESDRCLRLCPGVDLAGGLRSTSGNEDLRERR